MNEIIYWFGFAHAILYAVLGAVVFTWFCVSKILDRLGMGADLTRALFQYYRNKNKTKDIPG